MGNQKKQRDLGEILYALVFRSVETENISCQAGIYIYILFRTWLLQVLKQPSNILVLIFCIQF